MMKNFLYLLGLWVLLVSPALAQTGRTVQGSVTDAAGTALAGISVRVKNTQTGTTTNADGRFSVRVPSDNAVLVFSGVGFAATEQPVGNATEVNASLEADQTNLNEVVVTALGLAKEQRKLGYAVSNIEAKDIIKTSPTNFASVLYAKAPGVTINSNPGGATSAVAINIRGLNSIGYSRQPLLVVDGVVIRNGEANNGGFWDSPRINRNGLLDINPENIENVNILKGAAASALYGSDAANGVIVITTKSGKYSRGLGVSVNSSFNTESVSVVPDLQTLYGPGYDRTTNMTSFGADDQGWITQTVNGQQVQRPIFRAYSQFGPKMDGRQVYWWDGQMRPYTSEPNNWKKFYRRGYSSIQNIALENATDKANYRLSYTRNDYQGIQIGGGQHKNTFNLNTHYQLSSRLSTDLVLSYINEQVHNRPYQINRITNNYGGFFSPADKMSLYFDKYKTTKGYKWVPFNNTALNPEEAIKYNIRAYDFMDFLWNQLENSLDETTNRLMGSATVSYDLAKGLRLRGRLGTDYTGYFAETRNRATQPISFGATGSYSTAQNRQIYNYGDVLLTYNTTLTPSLNLNLSAGYQARKEEYRYSSQGTNNGLTQENWFSLGASVGNPTASSSRSYMVKDGLFGVVGLEYKNFLFLEATGRRERTSTLYPGNNVFFYPALSAAFELSNALDLPDFISYSKVRASMGVVGNPPPLYLANVVYSTGRINGIPVVYPPSTYGNNSLRNEQKREFELGWESRFFNSRMGFEVSYYNNLLKDQIIPLQVPSSTGSNNIVVNIGDMQNRGLELSLFGTPVKTSRLLWDARFNVAFNRNQLTALYPGLEELTNANFDNGSLLIVSRVGEPAGQIVGYKRKTDASGKYVIDDSGYYTIDFENRVNMGNAQPKAVGGLVNTFTLGNLSLSLVTDFRWGGQVVSLSNLYMTGAGMFNSTLAGRDAEHGGLPYYVNKDGSYVAVAAGTTAGPAGQKVYQDGIILDGVTATGEKNAKLIDAPNYYLNTFTWGSWPGSGSSSTYEGAVFDNNFVKMRELSLSYALPVALSQRLHTRALTLSVYGRNLFYFYKSLPNLDAEEAIGTNFVSLASTGGSNAATRSYGASLRFNF